MVLTWVFIACLGYGVLGRVAIFQSHLTEDTDYSSGKHMSEFISDTSGQIISNNNENDNKSPKFDFKDYVEFYLYTKKNMDSYQHLFLDDVNSIKSSNYNPNLPTFFVIHGYMDNVNSDIVQSIKNGILGQMESNVIAVDWSKITTDPFYNIIAQETPDVGTYVGKFVNFLIENGDKASNIHLIGHSLGAQAAGFAGKAVTSGKLKRITGLDPALPGFEGADKNNRIDAGDADFVDCIHTCGGLLGYLDPICQADYYPNGGQNVQPGCLLIDFGVCSHGRSHQYFAESIQPDHKFHTLKCPSIPQDNPTNCVASDGLMGFPASKQYQGIFYSKTNSAFPFAEDVGNKLNWKIMHPNKTSNF